MAQTNNNGGLKAAGAGVAAGAVILAAILSRGSAPVGTATPTPTRQIAPGGSPVLIYQLPPERERNLGLTPGPKPTYAPDPAELTPAVTVTLTIAP